MPFSVKVMNKPTKDYTQTYRKKYTIEIIKKYVYSLTSRSNLWDVVSTHEIVPSPPATRTLTS